MDNVGSIRLISLYRKRAKRYDWTTLLLYFVGFRHWTYRKRAIQLLALRQGDGRDREYIFDRVPKDLAVETYPLLAFHEHCHTICLSEYLEYSLYFMLI